MQLRRFFGQVFGDLRGGLERYWLATAATLRQGGLVAGGGVGGLVKRAGAGDWGWLIRVEAEVRTRSWVVLGRDG